MLKGWFALPAAPDPESYGSAVNASTAAFSYESDGESRDQSVTFTRNYTGTIYLRYDGDKAIKFDFSGAAFTIALVSGLDETQYAPTGLVKSLHSQGAALSGTITVGVEGFDIYVIDDGVEVVRFKSIHHTASGKVVCKEPAGQTRSAGDVTFAANTTLYSNLNAKQYDPRDFGMRSIATTGDITASSTTLTLASDAAGLGFKVGDRVIVETGAESGAGARGTNGVGGTWPALSYPDATARAAGTPANNTYAWQEDTGEVWRYVSSAWAQPYTSTNYNLFKAVPRALQATITAISGNDVTLSVAASETVADANVYLNCTPFINLMTYNIWYKFGSPAGDLRDFQPQDAEIVLPEGTFYFGGKIYLGAHGTGMRIRGQGDTTILKSPKGCPSIQIVAHSHTGDDIDHLKTVVSDLKMVGNVRDEGFGFDYASTSVIPYGSGSSGMEWSYNDSFVSETSLNTGGAMGSSVLIESSTFCEVVDVTHVDVWRAVGTSYATDCYVRSCDTTMTDGLRMYVQWHYQWADSTRGAIEDCTVTSPRLIAGFEVFRCDGTDITGCTGNNASYSSNSSGRFEFNGNTCAVTVTDNVQATTGFSPSNPMFNINSNIQPPSGAVADGGEITNCVMTQADYIDANKNTLRGIVVNYYNPNISVDACSYSAPDFPADYATAGTTLAGAVGISGTGDNMSVTNCTVVGKAKHEVVGGSNEYNIHLNRTPAPSNATQSGNTANEIYVAP